MYIKKFIVACNFERTISFNLVMMPLRDTPVPIPNTMVKPQRADGTARETVWESRMLPGNVARWSSGQDTTLSRW